MKKSYRQILDEAEKTVRNIFMLQVNPSFTFHTIVHTARVVSAAAKIMEDSNLDETDRWSVLMASWFHDTGFSTGHLEGHETWSIKIATDFLHRHKVPEDIIIKINACIAATRMPQVPLTFQEQVICDADLFHLGTVDFFDITVLLRKELQWYLKREFSDQDWDKGNITFLSAHKYFTPYGRHHLEPVKRQWIHVLEERITANNDKKLN